MEKIKVFLGLSQLVFREGMHFILESEDDMEVVGEGRTADEVIFFLQRQPVDVLVLSHDLEYVVRQVAKRVPFVGIIIIGDASSRRVAVGNSSFLTRDIEPEGFVRAVREASRKRFTLPTLKSDDETEEPKPDLKGKLLSLVECL